jgi:hypothetical protein
MSTIDKEMPHDSAATLPFNLGAGINVGRSAMSGQPVI